MDSKNKIIPIVALSLMAVAATLQVLIGARYDKYYVEINNNNTSVAENKVEGLKNVIMQNPKSNNEPAYRIGREENAIKNSINSENNNKTKISEKILGQKEVIRALRAIK